MSYGPATEDLQSPWPASSEDAVASRLSAACVSQPWCKDVSRGVLSARGPSSSGEVRGLVIHYIKEAEDVGQQEQQGDQRDAEMGDEVNGESKRSLNTRMKHGDDCEMNKAQT